MSTMHTRAVILLSGGLDSATVLAMARAANLECHTVAFDYGQRHRHELTAAALVAKALGAVAHRVITLDLRGIGGSALTADIDVPKDRTHAQMAGDIPITYVPARNLVFLSLGTALAEVLGATQLHIGVNAIDYSGYPDCRPEFIDSFESTARLATKAGQDSKVPPLRIVAPLMRMTKAQIIQAGAALGVPYALTHSCYDPLSVPQPPFTLACGHCDSCQLRREGFAAADVPDPTAYGVEPR